MRSRTRRTYKDFGSEPVPRDVLLALVDLARFAPNHHLTQPWRFRVIGPRSLARLKELAGPVEAVKLDRAPTLVLVSCVLTGDPVQDDEDLHATSAAVYAMLLGAHARGLAGILAHAGSPSDPGRASGGGAAERRARRRSGPPGPAGGAEAGEELSRPSVRHVLARRARRPADRSNRVAWRLSVAAASADRRSGPAPTAGLRSRRASITPRPMAATATSEPPMTHPAAELEAAGEFGRLPPASRWSACDGGPEGDAVTVGPGDVAVGESAGFGVGDGVGVPAASEYRAIVTPVPISERSW